MYVNRSSEGNAISLRGCLRQLRMDCGFALFAFISGEISQAQMVNQPSQVLGFCASSSLYVSHINHDCCRANSAETRSSFLLISAFNRLQAAVNFVSSSSRRLIKTEERDFVRFTENLGSAKPPRALTAH